MAVVLLHMPLLQHHRNPQQQLCIYLYIFLPKHLFCLYFLWELGASTERGKMLLSPPYLTGLSGACLDWYMMKCLMGPCLTHTRMRTDVFQTGLGTAGPLSCTFVCLYLHLSGTLKSSREASRARPPLSPLRRCPSLCAALYSCADLWPPACWLKRLKEHNRLLVPRAKKEPALRSEKGREGWRSVGFTKGSTRSALLCKANTHSHPALLSYWQPFWSVKDMICN